MTRILMLLFLATFLAAGCCRDERPVTDTGDSDPVLEDAGEALDLEPVPVAEDAVEEPASDPFGDERKLAELKDLHEEGRYSYLIPPAESLLRRTDLDPKMRIELAYLLAKSYKAIGEHRKAEEMRNTLKQLREQHLASKRLAAQRSLRTRVRKIVADMRQGGLEQLPEELQVRQNELIDQELNRALPEAVLVLDALGGGTIHCSRDAEALQSCVEDVLIGGEPPILSHDTEFDFYYVIEEEIPPEVR